MSIEVRYLRSGADAEIALELAEGATVADALAAAGVAAGSFAAHGIWGRVAALDTPLTAGDRVESYEALEADPKAARHRRVSRRNRPGGTF
jgi:hypothetical protein